MFLLGKMLGIAMILAGGGLAAYGAPYHVMEFGSMLVISGAVVGSSGAVVWVLAAVGTRLDRILRELRRGAAGEAPASAAGVAPAAAVEPAAAAGEAAEARTPPGEAPEDGASDVIEPAKAGEGAPDPAPDADGAIRDNLLADVKEATEGDAKAEAPEDAASKAEGPEKTAAEEAAKEEAAQPPEEPEAKEGTEPQKPSRTISDEGIAAAYTVGETRFTVFADGRIKAASPDGVHEFGSMEELRAFMETRRT